MNRMQEYDKRLGVPKFEGWQEREIESHKQAHEKSKKGCGVLHRTITTPRPDQPNGVCWFCNQP